jgi:protein-disulfide isomerase
MRFVSRGPHNTQQHEPLTKLQNRLLNVLVGVMTVGALTALGLRAREMWQGQSSSVTPRPTAISDWRSYAVHGEHIGAPGVGTTVTMFSDFQCPFCREAAQDLEQLRAQHPHSFSLIYRHYPLPFHKFAKAAASAAICAERQGRFQQMHDELFAKADSFGKVPWVDYAQRAGVPDLRRFEQCLDDISVARYLTVDSIAGSKLGVTGTPTFLINELRVVGYPGKDSLYKYIADRSALSEASAAHHASGR